VSGSWRDDVTTDAFKPSLLVDDTAELAFGFEYSVLHQRGQTINKSSPERCKVVGIWSRSTFQTSTGRKEPTSGEVLDLADLRYPFTELLDT
jgi:hypothetical protein